MDALPEIRSAVDFGCGVGTWLAVLQEKGVKEIQGIDGPWLKQELLEIPKRNFRQADFEDGVELDRRYDLAISLEVVEHLEPEAAETFVASLVRASDFILFSAAIPFQGGKKHVNEQWPDYWVALFARKGYVVSDFIRNQIWNDQRIPTWYRQNALMFVKSEAMTKLEVPDLDGPKWPIAVVHPERYLSKVEQIASVKGSFKLFRCAVQGWIKARIASVVQGRSERTTNS